ncbi:MAG: hypothetical protein JWL62_3827 [Hyphomicrobiales bacterium]|nr:hypothetical protein [Hyphomicrobiales bacterium]
MNETDSPRGDKTVRQYQLGPAEMVLDNGPDGRGPVDEKEEAPSSADSTLREKIVEHLFIGQLLRLIWSEGIRDIEVLKPEVDRAGYDIVIAVNGVVRHIQLKATRKGGKRNRVDLSTRLTERRGGCVVWLVVDEDNFELGPFYWLGSDPHLPLVLNSTRIGKHTKGNAQGLKAARPMMRTLSRGEFTRFDSVVELRAALFNPSQPPAAALALV